MSAPQCPTCGRDDYGDCPRDTCPYRNAKAGTIRQSADGITHYVDQQGRVWVPLAEYMRVVRKL